jgi:hypothetical protein
MRRDLLQGAGCGQRGFLQPGVHLFNVLEPLLKSTDPLTEGADFLRDRLEVFQAQENDPPWDSQSSSQPPPEPPDEWRPNRLGIAGKRSIRPPDHLRRTLGSPSASGCGAEDKREGER